MLLLPLLVTILICAPELRPSDASSEVETTVICPTASSLGETTAEPPCVSELTLTPSTMKLLSACRWPAAEI